MTHLRVYSQLTHPKPKKLYIVMAAPVGYECELVDQVPEHLICQQCKHVAREPYTTSCCGECFCKECIKNFSQGNKPCPICQESVLSPRLQRKYKAEILALKIHCSLKDVGCDWTGQLQHLDAHLDLATGDCVYVDVDCPSKCNQKVQKRNVNTHLTNHCPNRNRDCTCPHCSFKTTFVEISQHFETCQTTLLCVPIDVGPDLSEMFLKTT